MQLEGIVQKVVFQSGSFFVFDIRLDEAVDGRFLWTVRGHLFGLCSLVSGSPLRLIGQWGSHVKYGRQFKAKTWEPWYESSRTFRTFFSGCIRGADYASVNAICSRYGDDVLEVLKAPARILEEVSANQVNLSATVLAWEQAISTLQLSHLLQGVSSNDIEHVIQKLGPEAPRLLRENPYHLMRIPGFSLDKADEFAQSLGLPLTSPLRMGGAILSVLDDALQDGHLFLRPKDLPSIIERLPCEHPVSGDCVEGLETMAKQRAVLVEGTSRAYLPAQYEYERVTAAKIASLLQPSNLRVELESFLQEFQSSTSLELSEAQREVVRAVSQSRVLVITGLPGTGKSTSVRALVRLLERANVSVSLMAPTGIASQRLSNITGQPASTIHRALGYDGAQWRHGPDNKLITDAVIVDEMSMVDQELIFRLLVALRPDTILVLVGDAAQLPSVGAGNVLKELAACEALPRVQLTEIFRQSAQSGIVSNSHRINKGEFPELGDPKGDSEFKFIPLQDEEQIQSYVVRMAAKLKERNANFQVLTAKYGGVVGVDALNTALRHVLNPPGASEWRGGKQHFRVGDRVMVVKNDYKKGVYNGDVGKLLYIGADCLNVRIYRVDEDLIVNFTEPEAEASLRLAYAITVHKSQGNEFDTIIMPVVIGQGRMLQRNLLYTAVTRARKQVWLLGQRSAIQRAIDNNKVVNRNSVLARAIVGVLDRARKGESSGTSENRPNL